jgi:hypothetical protein
MCLTFLVYLVMPLCLLEKKEISDSWLRHQRMVIRHRQRHRHRDGRRHQPSFSWRSICPLKSRLVRVCPVSHAVNYSKFKWGIQFQNLAEFSNEITPGHATWRLGSTPQLLDRDTWFLIPCTSLLKVVSIQGSLLIQERVSLTHSTFSITYAKAMINGRLRVLNCPSIAPLSSTTPPPPSASASNASQTPLSCSSQVGIVVRVNYQHASMTYSFCATGFVLCIKIFHALQMLRKFASHT